MNHNIFVIAGLLGVGAVIGATLNSPSEPEPAAHVPTEKQKPSQAQQPANPFSSNVNISSSDTNQYEYLSKTVESLQARLNQEIDKRQALEKKIALLEKSVATAAPKNNENDNQPSQVSETDQSPHQFNATSGNTNWFNEEALVDAGVDPTRVSYLKDAFEQAEMEKLYLRDQATREGWMGTKRYQDAAKKIADRTSSLRSELTGPEYDAYLYATGRSNRVIVESVLGGSPASNAGIEAGDTILRYDNKQIYSWSDLTTATSEGDPNATVMVTVERNGQQQQLYVPRGPLGIRLTTDSVAP